jgi:enoyl-[acyl-carrier protein] reductase II
MPELLSMLGCRYPIIQGPIGRVNNPAFVAAISNAGAFGLLALGFEKPDTAKRLINEVKDLTDKPFGANVVIMNPAALELLDLLAEAGVKAVTTSVGSPAKIYKRIHELGMKGIHVVLSLQHAKSAEDAGADGLVVAGAEAGGLRTRKPESSTLVLVPLVADHVKIPIVAAGGIADSRGYRAAMALGAQGVQIGTRFLASVECPIHEKWKQMIAGASDGGTILFPVHGNMSTRVVVTPKIKEAMQNPETELTNLFDMKNASKALETGNFDLFPPGAGQVSALIREIKPVGEIIRQMVA